MTVPTQRSGKYRNECFIYTHSNIYQTFTMNMFFHRWFFKFEIVRPRPQISRKSAKNTGCYSKSFSNLLRKWQQISLHKFDGEMVSASFLHKQPLSINDFIAKIVFNFKKCRNLPHLSATPTGCKHVDVTWQYSRGKIRNICEMSLP